MKGVEKSEGSERVGRRVMIRRPPPDDLIVLVTGDITQVKQNHLMTYSTGRTPEVSYLEQRLFFST